MKASLRLVLFLLCLCSSDFLEAQAYNPFTQSIKFNPEPSVLGFQCDSTTTVEFIAGLATANNAPLVPGDEVVLKICIDGFDWTSASVKAVVNGDYAGNFSWSFDPMIPDCILGVQSGALPGTGANPIFPDPLSTGLISLGLMVPDSIVDQTLLKVDVEIIPAAYMVASNSTPDDVESTQTQVFCPTSNLPLTLTAFDARVYDCNVLLSWESEHEENTSHTEIYRVKVGTNEPPLKVGELDLAGYSDIERTYSFIDRTATPGNDYNYQLKFVDLDNTFDVSKVVRVNLDCAPSTNLASVFPSPASNTLNFSYQTSNSDIQLFFDVLDMSGRKILSQSGLIPSGSDIFKLDVSSLATGHYFLKYYSMEEGIGGNLKFVKK